MDFPMESPTGRNVVVVSGLDIVSSIHDPNTSDENYGKEPLPVTPILKSGIKDVNNEISWQIDKDAEYIHGNFPVTSTIGLIARDEHNRRASTETVMSALTHHIDDQPRTGKTGSKTDATPARRKASMVTWNKSKTNPNQPHPSLEYPPLYFLIRRSPRLLEIFKGLYRQRWRFSYPLQKRIPFNCAILQRLNCFLTVGELLLILPFIAALLACTVYSFIFPSVSISGQTARTPLIFAFVTAMRNSPLTLLFGIPVDRAIWYHKLCARLAYINGMMHTIVSFVYPKSLPESSLPPPTSATGTDPHFGRFLFADEVNSGGTMLLVFMTLMIVTALPFVRRRVFELFYYLHLIFATSMVVCAFFHTGILVPTLVCLTWGIDLVIRKVYMAHCRYPKKASVRIISESVIELCFPKADGFDYNPGQYIYIAIPELSLFEWHPFSLSSSPEQKVVTLHIRKAGNWTSALFDLAMKKMDVSIMLEGPYGSVGVDIDSDRYKMIMLLSGGIGVTPMQALCNQLMYEQSANSREIKKLSFIWIERDPNAMTKVDVVRRNKAKPVIREMDEEQGLQSGVSGRSLARILLALVPRSNVSNKQLEQEYSTSYGFEVERVDEDSAAAAPAKNRYHFRKGARNTPGLPTISGTAEKSLTDADHDTICQTLLDAAYCRDDDDDSLKEILDLQVYLTTRTEVCDAIMEMPFVQYGRPDLPSIFRKMREDAIVNNECRVAVCICAPEPLVLIVKKACMEFTDKRVQFDLHNEIFG